MLWKLATIARSSYFAFIDYDSRRDYFVNVVLRPATVVLLYGYVSRTVGTSTDIRRVVVGSAVLVLNWTVVNGALWTVGGELINGTLGMNIAAPTRRYQLLAAKILIHIPNGTLSVASTILIGALVFQLGFGGVNWLLFVIAVLLVVVSFAALGLVCGVITLVTRETNGFIGISALYLGLFSGAVVPVSALPGALEAFSIVVPGRWGVAALHAALAGDGFGRVWLDYVREVAVGAGYFVLAWLGLLAFERRAKSRGSTDLV